MSGTTKNHNKSQAGDGRTGELFVVATPIGNLSDITLRALETLKSVDLIACEDTRNSGVLMKHYGITTRLIAYHDHNEASAAQSLVEKMHSGLRVALISDAGTPLVSDPGARLVAAAIQGGIRVTPIPGASALLSALSVAGLPSEQFFFAGFLPMKSVARKEMLARLAPIQATVILYEAPHRLDATLALLADTLGDRPAVLARELTKLHEECRRGTLRGLADHYAANAARGECVILFEGARPQAAMSPAAVDKLLLKLLATYSLKEAVAEAASISGLPKRQVYARALSLREDK